MAITYPLSAPAALQYAALRFTPKSIVGVSPSIFTGQQQVYAHQGQWWELEIVTPRMARAALAPIVAWLCALNGREGTFTIGDKLCAAPRGTISGSPTVNGAATRGSTTLAITGHAGTLALGDWIQIGTSLYLVTQVNSSSSIDVFPRLRSAYANGTSVIYSSPKGLFRLQAEVPWNANDVGVYDSLNISAMEVLP